MTRQPTTAFSYAIAVTLCAACGGKDAATDTARSARNPTPSLPAATDQRVTPAGYDAVHVGASVQELSSAIGTSVPRAANPADAECRYVFLNTLPKGMRLMLVNDTVARIEVDAAGVRTAEDAGVGDTEPSLLERYGTRAVVTPHKYTGPVGHYVTVTPENDTLHRTIFETDGRTVLRYRAGRRPEVDNVEGCG